MNHRFYLVCLQPFLEYKHINSVVKVFFACILKMYCFYEFIINLVRIGAFMLFPRMINPFLATDLFWCPSESIRKLLVFWCFQGVSKEISVMKWVNDSKNIVVKNGQIDICNWSCCHSNYFKIINVSDWELCKMLD